jgi:hypothetical protein
MLDLQHSGFYCFFEWPNVFNLIYSDVEVRSLYHICEGWLYNPKRLLKALADY